MVISWMAGGLGNQMFQYAATFVLAQRLGLEMKFDTSHFDRDKNRELSLDCFGIEIDKASFDEISSIVRWHHFPINLLPQSIQNKLRKVIAKHKVKENGEVDQLNDLNSNADYYLKGYWQNEAFFEKQEVKIRERFKFMSKSDRVLVRLREEMASCESVAVHLRRTDYVTNNKARDLLGTLTMKYYKSAAEYLESKLSVAKYFVFSDDLEWAKNNLKLGKQIRYVDTKGKKDYVDMQLMSNCRHNIIANSSFSWWGAWLNNNQGKIVVAPKNWFRDRTANKKNPASKKWIKITNE